MALLPINAHDSISDAELLAALSTCPPGRPVVIMIHGFKFDPKDPQHSPHRHILSATPSRTCWKARSWPRQLRVTKDDGLGIAFGWSARGSIWEAYARVPAAALSLSRILAALHRLAPLRPVHIIGHSLGARIALLALDGLPAGAVQRMILMSGAVFKSEARAAMASAAGATAEVFSVTGRENTLFDLLLRSAFPWAGPTVGRGGLNLPNWLDLPLDRCFALTALKDLGFRIAPPKTRICHWSGYLRPGIFSLYRALVHRPAETPLPFLRDVLDKASPAPFLWAPNIPAGGIRLSTKV